MLYLQENNISLLPSGNFDCQMMGAYNEHLNYGKHNLFTLRKNNV